MTRPWVATRVRKTYIDTATPLMMRRPSRLGGQHRGEGVVDEHDVGDVACDGAAAAHGDPDVGVLERAGVVHTVADHRDVVVLSAQGGDDVFLLLGVRRGRTRWCGRR